MLMKRIIIRILMIIIIELICVDFCSLLINNSEMVKIMIKVIKLNLVLLILVVLVVVVRNVGSFRLKLFIKFWKYDD